MAHEKLVSIKVWEATDEETGVHSPCSPKGMNFGKVGVCILFPAFKACVKKLLWTTESDAIKMKKAPPPYRDNQEAEKVHQTI